MLHVVTSDVFAGIERHVVSLARAQLTHGCVAEIACPIEAERLRAVAADAGIPAHPRGADGGGVARAVARWTIEHPHDILHAHDGRGALLCAAASLRPAVRLVRTQHFLQPATMDRAGLAMHASLFAHRIVNRRADAYIAVSDCVARAAESRGEVRGSLLTVIPPAVDLATHREFQTAVLARESLPRPVVVFAGRLERERRLDVLIRAIPSILDALPDCSFVFAGSGDAADELRELAREMGVTEVVTWYGWRSDIADVMSEAHLYVNTWPQEAFGMAMAEAMSFGLPVVAVDDGANREMVDDGVTGTVVPPDDPEALADAVLAILGDRARAVRMGAAARQRAVSLYGAERTAVANSAAYSRTRR